VTANNFARGSYISPLRFEETGWPINPSKPLHEVGCGMLILEARSVAGSLTVHGKYS
jgi:hypothetical protein